MRRMPSRSDARYEPPAQWPWPGEQKVQNCHGQPVPGGKNYNGSLVSEAGLSQPFRL